MAERACRYCGGIYLLPTGNPDPRFCSDRCFSRSQPDDTEAPSRFWWVVRALVFLAMIGMLMFRYEVATALAEAVPDARPAACRVLAWLGGDGVDRLLAMVLAPGGELRAPALDALAHVSDPVDAHARIVGRIEELRTVEMSLSPELRGKLLVAYGACGIVEQLDSLLTSLSDDRYTLDVLRGLARMHDARATQPLLELLSDADVRYVSRPDYTCAILATLALQPDTDRTLMSRFFGFLAHDNAQVRAAAARAIAALGADYQELKERLSAVPAADRYLAKQRLARVEKGLAALQAAGPAEKVPDARAALAESVERMAGRPPEWVP